MKIYTYADRDITAFRTHTLSNLNYYLTIIHL